MKEGIGIGSTVWRFDENHRVYLKKNAGPDYRSHWVPRKITGETSRSWIASGWYKVPKKGEAPGWVFSEQELNDLVFINDHKYNISEAVRFIQDAATLRKVAAVIGYDAGSEVGKA